MKNGTAISANTSMPLNRYLGSAMSGSPPTRIAASVRTAQRERDRHAEREQHDAADEQRRDHSFDRVRVEFVVGQEALLPHVRRRHQQQVHDQQREADRHREVHGADRDLQHRRRLRPT